jgi:hypothetical protein
MEFRAIFEINKAHADAHYFLGEALQRKGLYGEAIVQYREALRIEQDSFRAQQKLRQAEELMELEKRLPAILLGQEQLNDTGTILLFARICRTRTHQRYVSAARYFGEAFSCQLTLAEDLESSDRYNAAKAAVLAASGEGKDAADLDAKERARLRQLALDWLRADLTNWGRLLDKEPDKGSAAANFLGHWLDDPDLLAVRSPEALAKLPKDEQKLWRILWEDVASMSKRAREKTAMEKIPRAQ